MPSREDKTRQRKLTANEMGEYYTRVHRESLLRYPQDSLDAVTRNGGNLWVNRFCDYAHRLGMKKAFAYLETQWGSLSRRSVLDLGCGRGRWVKEYASHGAIVTGLDISPEAIDLLAREMPQHRFLCQDLSRFSALEATFDVVNSVTVLQHLPEETQQAVMPRIVRCLKHGGYFVALESTVDEAAPHVFPRSRSGWTQLVESAGLNLCSSWGSNFEVLFRVLAPLARLFPREPRDAMCSGLDGTFENRHSFRRQLRSGFQTTFALASFPLECALDKLPLARPTHQVMIFCK